MRLTKHQRQRRHGDVNCRMTKRFLLVCEVLAVLWCGVSAASMHIVQVIVYKIDGSKDKLFCQNLCLFSKMFLDGKTLVWEVRPATPLDSWWIHGGFLEATVCLMRAYVAGGGHVMVWRWHVAVQCSEPLRHHITCQQVYGVQVVPGHNSLCSPVGFFVSALCGMSKLL